MKGEAKYLETPVTDEAIAELRTGDKVLINGPILTIRDSSSKRLRLDIAAGRAPIDFTGQLVFYIGPAPAPPGRPIGSAGPTTSRRMDAYVADLISAGAKAFMGKGRRSEPARLAMLNGQTVYLVATGGVGALLSHHISEATLIAYPELGPEAIYKFMVDDFPAIVADDIYGGDLFKKEWVKWRTRTKAVS